MNGRITIESLARAARSGNDIKRSSGSSDAILKFSAEDRVQIEKIKEEIDLTDSITTVEFGIGCQRKLAEFADRVIENFCRGNTDTAEQLQALIGEIKALDSGLVLKDSFWARVPIIGSRARGTKKLKRRFAKSRIRIERLEQDLERSRMELLKGSELLEMMSRENTLCFRELTLYIQAGKERLEHIKAEVLPKLQEEAETRQDPMSAQLVNGFRDNLAHFDNRICDLELSRTVALQSAPQIKIIQTGNNVMAQKIQSAVLNTIPIWKNQFAAAVGLADQTRFCKTQHELDKMTNAMARRNAELLRQSAMRTAAESRRNGIDVEALRGANDSLIRVIEDTLRLNQESSMKHRKAEAELTRIDRHLKEALSHMK